MWTVFVETLKESIHRRIALALIVVAALFFVVQVSTTHFSRSASGELMITNMDRKSAPAPAQEFIANQAIPSQLQLLANLWVFLSLFAVTSLLTSYMDKGWVELLLTKGTPRWQIFAGRYLGCVGLFVLTASLMNVVAIVYFCLRADVPMRPYFVALSFILVSFLGALALIALISTTQSNSGLLVLVVFLELMVSGVLANREMIFKGVTAQWALWAVKWAYRIVPKHEEINRMAMQYVTRHSVANWFPLWTTATVFAVATVWAFWRFERKAF